MGVWKHISATLMKEIKVVYYSYEIVTHYYDLALN